MRTNSPCTIYNKYIVNRVATFQRVQIAAVAWENRKAKNSLAVGGGITANQARIFIPFARGLNYVEPIAWQALVNKAGFWTLQKGDVIAKGLIATDIENATQLTQIKETVDNVFVIDSIDTMDGGSISMHHWQIEAK